MLITCPKCQKSYEIENSKVPNKASYTSCQFCGNRFLMQRTAESVPPPMELHLEQPPKPSRSEIGESQPRHASPPREINRYPESRYGGFWIRVVASLIDSVILLIPSYMATCLVFYSMDHTAILLSPNTPIQATQFAQVMMNWIDGTCIWWVYSAALWSSSWQATLGKKICGLKVIGYNGERLSFGKASGRYFASCLSAAILFIGLIMVAFTQKKQGLHDFMAGTLVVRVDP